MPCNPGIRGRSGGWRRRGDKRRRPSPYVALAERGEDSFERRRGVGCATPGTALADEASDGAQRASRGDSCTDVGSGRHSRRSPGSTRILQRERFLHGRRDGCERFIQCHGSIHRHGRRGGHGQRGRQRRHGQRSNRRQQPTRQRGPWIRRLGGRVWKPKQRIRRHGGRVWELRQRIRGIRASRHWYRIGLLRRRIRRFGRRRRQRPERHGHRDIEGGRLRPQLWDLAEPVQLTVIAPGARSWSKTSTKGCRAVSVGHEANRRLRRAPLAHEGVGQDLCHAGADVLERAHPAPR